MPAAPHTGVVSKRNDASGSRIHILSTMAISNVHRFAPSLIRHEDNMERQGPEPGPKRNRARQDHLGPSITSSWKDVKTAIGHRCAWSGVQVIRDSTPPPPIVVYIRVLGLCVKKGDYSTSHGPEHERLLSKLHIRTHKAATASFPATISISHIVTREEREMAPRFPLRHPWLSRPGPLVADDPASSRLQIPTAEGMHSCLNSDACLVPYCPSVLHDNHHGDI